jgi:hypothetical protein
MGGGGSKHDDRNYQEVMEKLTHSPRQFMEIRSIFERWGGKCVACRDSNVPHSSAVLRPSSLHALVLHAFLSRMAAPPPPIPHNRRRDLSGYIDKEGFKS